MQFCSPLPKYTMYLIFELLFSASTNPPLKGPQFGPFTLLVITAPWREEAMKTTHSARLRHLPVARSFPGYWCAVAQSTSVAFPPAKVPAIARTSEKDLNRKLDLARIAIGCSDL
jgi:hypothetical protein